MLVAIAIPVFTSQLAKSEMATDLANVRAAYAEGAATALADGQLTASGKIAVTFTNPCKKCTLSNDSTNHKLIVTHSKRSSVAGSFEYNSDAVLTIN